MTGRRGDVVLVGAWRLLLKYYRSYATFRHIYNMMLVSLLVSIILLGSILSGLFSSVLTRQTNDISTRMLSRLTFIIRQIYEETYSVMLSLGYGENIDLNSMMFAPSPDRLRDYSGFTQMRLLQTIYPSISYIGVYSSVRNDFMCTVGLEEDSQNIIRESIMTSYNQKNANLVIPMTSRMRVPMGYDPDTKTLTMFYYSPLSGPDRIGAVFVGIDCEHLSQYIETVNKHDNQRTFIVNTQGMVLSHPDHAQIFADYHDLGYVQRALSAETTTGYFFVDIDNGKNLVTYLQDATLGWTYITLTPQDEITRLIRRVHYATILSSLSILLIGTVLSLMAAKSSFNPIASLLTRTGYQPDKSNVHGSSDIGYLNDKFASYIQSISTNETVLLNHALKSFLLGADEWDKENAEQLEKHRETLNAPFYMICLLKITRAQQYLDMARSERQFHQYSLAQIASAHLGPCTQGVMPVLMSSSTVAMILQLSTHRVPKDLVFAVIETRNSFQKHSRLASSASLSDVCNDLYLLPEAYKEAVQLISERYFTGEDDIFQARERRIVTAGYNTRLEHEIWSGIQAGDGKTD